MSQDSTNILDQVEEIMQKDIALERVKADVQEKRAYVDQKRYTAQVERMKQNEKDLELAKNLDLNGPSDEYVNELQKTNLEYLHAAKDCMQFINPSFHGIVPFFRKNLILVAGSSGDGKSTAAANVAYSVMQQINPETGKNRRVLLLTNEEQSEDFYNRITCLTRGWPYSNHQDFTDEQRATFDRALPVWAKGGWLNVIDDDYGGSSGMTTSLEGIESIFKNLIENGIHYDCVVFDYYQNVITSKTDPNMKEFEVQAHLSRMLDHYKNVYSAPIVLLAQCRPPSSQDPKPFKERIEGRKLIYNSATIAMEQVAHKKEFMTEWVVWKSRFNTGIGDAVETGFDHGKYVPYTNDFKESIARMLYERTARQMDRDNGLRNVFSNGEENAD